MGADAGAEASDKELPTLVFAHHFGGSGRCWRPLAERLGPRFECRMPDLAGFGGSAAPVDLNLEAYASKLETASDRPYVLAGHSMGAKIAMLVAAKRPPRLRGLVLIAPSPPTPEPMEENERRAFLAEFGDRAKARTRIDGLTRARLAAEFTCAYVDDQVSVDAKVWRWWLQEGSKNDVSSCMAGLDLPVLVIAAADDPAVSLTTAFEVAKRFAGSEFRVLADSGHLAPVEQPGELAILIEAFVCSL